MKLPLSNIKIGPRQRQDVGDLDELAESLARVGQIHSIGVRAEDMRLVWGYRRFLSAQQLGWTEIEAIVREGLSDELEQEIELEEDIRRKDRTWQEYVLAIHKLYHIKRRAARAKNEKFNLQDMASYSGLSRTLVYQYAMNLGEELIKIPKSEIWECGSYVDAIQVLRKRQELAAMKEIDRRNALLPKQFKEPATPTEAPSPSPSIVQPVNKTLSLAARAQLYNQKFSHLGPPNTPIHYSSGNGREFITGFWFTGGGNISDLYGSYQTEYLKRIETLFPDSHKTLHLFSGNIPPSDKYLRVGLPEGDFVPDVLADAHKLSSILTFKADLIYADPPYSHEDSEHYSDSMVNRAVVLDECAQVLEPGGFIVWLDQGLPTFKNELLQLVGCIGYLRSTSNRYRMIAIFRKL